MGSSANVLLDRFSDMPVVVVLRGCPTEHVLAVAETAVSAGVRVIEVTLDTPEATSQIAILRDGLAETLIGAGTVRSSDQVDIAVQAGARFIVAPDTKHSVVSRSTSLDVPCVPGAATPTEIEHAFDLGAVAVKIFPACQLGGPSYVKALRAPLHGIPLLPTGGIDASNAADYLAAGAIAVGVGACIFSVNAMASGDCPTIATATRNLVNAIT